MFPPGCPVPLPCSWPGLQGTSPRSQFQTLTKTHQPPDRTRCVPSSQPGLLALFGFQSPALDLPRALLLSGQPGGDSTSGRAACLPSAQSVCESWEGFRYLGLSQNLLDPLPPIVPARDLGNEGRRRWLKFATNFATWARLCVHVRVHVMLGCCVRGSAPLSLNLQLIHVVCRSNQATERSGEEVNLIN